MRTLLLYGWLILSTVSVLAQSPWTSSDQARLSVRAATGGFTVTLTNVGKRPLAVLPMSSHWTHHWSVRVADREGHDHGLLVPPGPAFMPEPKRFSMLMPGESLSATHQYRDFSHLDRATGQTVALSRPARVIVRYTLDPKVELTRVGDPKSWVPLFTKADFLLPCQHEWEVKGSPVVSQGEVPWRVSPDGKARVKLLQDDPGASMSLLRFEAGARVPLHRHPESAEMLYMLSGEGQLEVSGHSFRVRAGDAIRIPLGEEHAFQALQPGDLVQIYTPPGPELRFLDWEQEN